LQRSAADHIDTQLQAIFAGVEGESDPKALQSKLQSARFWLLLQEGDRHLLLDRLRERQRYLTHLQEETARCQASSDFLAQENQDLIGQVSRLGEELRQLKGERDRLVGEAYHVKEHLKMTSEESRRQIKTLSEEVKHQRVERDKLHSERSALEAQLVGVKIKLAEAQEKQDNLETLVGYYTKQLERYAPHILAQIQVSIHPRSPVKQGRSSSISGASPSSRDTPIPLPPPLTARPDYGERNIRSSPGRAAVPRLPIGGISEGREYSSGAGAGGGGPGFLTFRGLFGRGTGQDDHRSGGGH